MKLTLQKVLADYGITQADLIKGAGLARSTVSRIVVYSSWPQRDAEAPVRIANYLRSRGVDEALVNALQNEVFPQQKKLAPDVFPHTEANPIPALETELEQEESMLLRNENLTPAARQAFGLPRSPFVDDVRTRADVFACASTRYVRASLLDAALNHGFVAIVGESGSGKTTLVDELEERLNDEGKQVIIIRPYVLAMEENDDKGRTLKSAQIAEAAIRSLDPSAALKSSAEARFNQLHGLLKTSRAAGYSHLLVIEEAHCLPVATLKHLKRFLELKQGLSRLIGVCLVGQPELKNRLADRKAEVREVVQRCELIELAPLDNDLESYLKHKFERINANVESVLAKDAYDAIRARLIRMPRGGKPSDALSLCHPLVVNNLVTRAMNAAAAAGWPKVDAQVIGGC